MTTTPIRPELVPVESGARDHACLGDAFGDAARVTRARAKNFFYGLRLTPEPRRSALYALYAWMRLGDDLVDEPGDLSVKRRSFEAFRASSLRAFDGRAPRDVEHSSWWHAFADTCERWPLSRERLHDMLSGLAEDLDHRAYPTEAAVDRYCERVGSSVGVLCTNVWGVRDGASESDAERLAALRGLAFQRTNILRDIGGDSAGEGGEATRSYVSDEMLESHAIRRSDLESWADPSRCEALVSDLASRARAAFDGSRSLDRLVSPDCVGVLRAMTDIYSGVLRCVERRPERAVLGPRARVHPTLKMAIAGRAVVSSVRASAR